MNCSTVREFLDTKLSRVFKCQEGNGFLRIETPFSFPDGDIMDLFLHERDGRFVLSDLGETLRYLGTYNLDIGAYSKRQEIISDLTASHRIRFHRGTLSVVLQSLDEMPDRIFDLAQCAIRVTDLLYTVRGMNPTIFRDEVKTFLMEEDFPFIENYTVPLPNGRKYDFDFGVGETHKSLVRLIHAPANPKTRPNAPVTRTIATWFDINTQVGKDYPIQSRITLLDDTRYQWGVENLVDLLGSVSLVVEWSRRDSLKELLITGEELA